MTVAPPTEPMPTQPVTQPTPPPTNLPVVPQQQVVYQTSCYDKFSRCGNWATQCGNKSIAGLCQKTCGLCGVVQQVAPPQVVVAPSAPVVQTVVQPVPVQAQQMFVNPYGNVAQNVYTTGCTDSYSRCNLWMHECGNPNIQTICKRSCNLCGNQPSLVNRLVQPVQQIVQPVQYQPVVPVQPVQPVQPVYSYGHDGIDHSVTCVDRFSRCHNWKSECNNLSLQKLCQKTCGLCDKSPVPQVTDTTLTLRVKPRF